MVEAYAVEFTFNNSKDSSAVSRNNINGGNNHILQAKALFCYMPGNFPIVTTDTQKYNVVLKLPETHTGTMTAYVGCIY
jgi:hypothetical protein